MAAPGKGLPLGEVAEAILSGIVSHYQAADVKLPERRVIVPGAPELIAFDCPMLAVTCSGVGQGWAPGQGPTTQRAGVPLSAMMLRHGIFTATLLRPDPPPLNGGRTPPSVESLTRAGLALMRDAGLMSQAMLEIVNSVVSILPKGAVVDTGAVNTIGPEGGFHGVTATLAATAGELV
jgi:hypothetical protein